MNKFNVNVLGCPYRVLIGKQKDINISKENMGECRTYDKAILVKTNKMGCNKGELRVRTQEVLAHEIFHAYINESGLELDCDVEEALANMYMKNWEKMHNTIMECMCHI